MQRWKRSTNGQNKCWSDERQTIKLLSLQSFMPTCARRMLSGCVLRKSASNNIHSTFWVKYSIRHKKRGISNCELKVFVMRRVSATLLPLFFVLLTLFTRHDHMFVIFRLNIGEFFFNSFLLFRFCCAHFMVKQIVISFTDSLGHWKILNLTQFT